MGDTLVHKEVVHIHGGYSFFWLECETCHKPFCTVCRYAHGQGKCDAAE